VGEVERVPATYGTSFGSYSHRVNGSPEKHPKKQHREDEHHQQDDAIELHEEGSEEAKPQTVHLTVEQDEHLDLSA